jgi:GH24 family phage-related lysozyme (muramidase)
MPVEDRILSEEGIICFLYLDTANPPVTTCGTGHALFTIEDSLRLPWDQPESQVRLDWAAVRAAPPGRLARFYANLTKSRLTEQFVRDLLAKDIQREVGRLKHYLPGLDGFPVPVQEGLTDMAFNLGGNFPGKWPNFTRAVLAGDWEKAAQSCHRAGISEDRNRDTAALFRSAIYT